MRLILCLMALVLPLAACSTKPAIYADDAAIRAASYRDPGPAYITVYTMIRNQTGGGGHSAMLINASQRVIFDPAGSFYLDVVPERNDVLYGITPNVEFYYRSSHARSTYHVLSQTFRVSPEQAELAFELAKQAGPVADALCADSVGRILRQLDVFESVTPTMFPAALSKQLSQLPGVTEFRYYEDDDPDLQAALADNNARLAAQKKQ